MLLDFRSRRKYTVCLGSSGEDADRVFAHPCDPVFFGDIEVLEDVNDERGSRRRRPQRWRRQRIDDDAVMLSSGDEGVTEDEGQGEDVTEVGGQGEDVAEVGGQREGVEEVGSQSRSGAEVAAAMSTLQGIVDDDPAEDEDEGLEFAMGVSSRIAEM